MLKAFFVQEGGATMQLVAAVLARTKNILLKFNYDASLKQLL